MDKIDQLLASQGLSKARLESVRNARNANDGIERVGVHGHLRILGIANDKVWTISDEPNIITNTGFLLLASMWGGPTAPETYSTLRPAKIAIGTGLDASPTAAMTTLQMGASPTYITDITQTVFIGSPNTNGVRFELLIPNGTVSDPYNGEALQEAGLFPANYSGSSTGAGGMISYRTYPVINKTDQFSLLYQWTYTFTSV